MLEMFPSVYKRTVTNFDPPDGNSIVRTIDFWKNFSTRRSVFYIENAHLDDLNRLTDRINLNKNRPGFVKLKIIKGQLQRFYKLMSYERAFKMLKNDMCIIEIGQAVLEL